jgi:Peptide methionine sulfoxide reductase
VGAASRRFGIICQKRIGIPVGTLQIMTPRMEYARSTSPCTVQYLYRSRTSSYMSSLNQTNSILSTTAEQIKTFLSPRTIIIASLILLMATQMPTFISRLFRPFATSTRLGLNADGASTINTPEGAAKATVAAGCFWGVEHAYRKQFGGKGLYDARVGYIGGDTKAPSYRAVCSGRTGRMSIFHPNHMNLIH